MWLTRFSGAISVVPGAGDTRIVFRGNETSAGPGRQVEDQVWPRFAQRLDDLRIVIELHRRTPGLGIADMDVNHGGNRLQRLPARTRRSAWA